MSEEGIFGPAATEGVIRSIATETDLTLALLGARAIGDLDATFLGAPG